MAADEHAFTGNFLVFASVNPKENIYLNWMLFKNALMYSKCILPLLFFVKLQAIDLECYQK